MIHEDEKKRVTIDDIAKRLSISKSVVSRALNDKYGVKEETRSKILITALEMDYKFEKDCPSKSRASNICVVVPRTHLLYDDYYGKILYGIESTLKQMKKRFYLQIIEKHGYMEMLLNLKKLNSDGIIIIGLVSYKNVALVISSGIPAVLVDTLHFNLNIDRITVNNYMGAYNATEYLLKKNHKNIAFFGYSDYSFNLSERYRGFEECINDNNKKSITDSSVITKNWNDEVLLDVDSAIKKLNSDNRPTGILCANDKVAFKVYELANQLNLKIPEDLSVIGFDNVEKCSWISPKLTSVNIPKFELGQEAVCMLVKQIENKIILDKDTPSKLLMLDTKLSKKESVILREKV